MCSLGCPSPGIHSPRFTAPHPLRHMGIPTIFQSPAHSSLKWPMYPPGNVPYVTAGKRTLWGCLSLATRARAAYCSTPVPTQPQLPEQSTKSSWRAQCTPAWRRQSHRAVGVSSVTCASARLWVSELSGRGTLGCQCSRPSSAAGPHISPRLITSSYA